MTTRFIVSVGTSLIGWYNKHILSESEKIGATEKEWQDDLEDSGRSFDRLLKEKIRFLPLDKISYASAELSTMFKEKSFPPQPEDVVRLVYTDTLSAAACARSIQSVLETQLSFKNVRLEKIENLSDASAIEFYDKGLPNLIGYLHQQVMEAGSCGQQIVFLPTGGYKALIPYYVILGVLFKIPCRYVYEESDRVIELPPLPLHVDLCEWTGVESVLETLHGKAPSAKNAWSVAATPKYARILNNLLVENKNGNLEASPLCTTLRKRVSLDRRRSELQFRTLNSPLLEYLVTESDGKKDESLKRFFLALADIGPYLWKGDRVPEMADHSLLHHADLFHLAERLLLPIFCHYELKLNRCFLAPVELFILLGALHLHDCGHVLGTIDLDGESIRLFPTEIRDHHHVLGFLRLTEPERHGGSGKIILEKLHQKLHDVFDLETIKALVEPIAAAGLYHRKKMNLSGMSFTYPFFTRKEPYLGSLEARMKSPMMVMGNELPYDRAALLVALLRIIDGLDEQASRTGGPDEIAFHLAQLETEAREESRRAEGLKTALSTLKGYRAAFEAVETVLHQRIYDYFHKEGKGRTDPVIEKKASGVRLDPEGFRACFDQIIARHCLQDAKPLFFEYAYATLRSFFKSFQKIPYGEKAFIRKVHLAGDETGDDISIHVDLEMEDDPDVFEALFDKVGETVTCDSGCFDLKGKAGRDGFKRHMLNELRKEYEAEGGIVSSLLKKNHIIADYGE
ncbi:MAG: hypothetical protein C4530_03010 [Desulfobacteraceae bacterium]|nr:MAG: hypothetical protein C4530_03010 [Desulfobacteraceae bacterium]